MNKTPWQNAILPYNSSIVQALNNLNEVALKITLVVDADGKLMGTVADGDIRRGLLKGLGLNDSVALILNPRPLVVTLGMDPQVIVTLMKANKIHQVPIVDHLGHVRGLHVLDEIISPSPRSNLMVIMAGGIGSRLMPFTEKCPKPLVPVAGKPMMQHIIERAKLEGLNHFIVATRYLSHMIKDYFKDGEDFDVRIEYLEESIPMGTAGALSLLKTPLDGPILVTNGDVISDIRYGDLIEFHERHYSDATMAVRTHEWRHPFGVVDIEGVNIIGFEEKPIARSHINAGIYVLSPEALNFLNEGEACDMPVLFERLKDASKSIVAYPMHEPWLDVGRPEDLKFANNTMEK